MKDRALLAILAAGLAVHLLSAGFVIAKRIPVSPMQDAFEYRTVAMNVLKHGTFSISPPSEKNPDLLRGPGYPLFLAATYAVEEHGYLAIVLQQLMLVASAALAFLLFGVFAVPRKIALALTAVFLLEPQQWLHSLQTMSEPLYGLAFLALAALALVPTLLPPVRRHVVFGLLFGISLLVKPTSVPTAALFVLTLLIADASAMKRRLQLAALACGIAALIMAPWVARNHRLTGEWLFSSSPAFNFVHGLGSPLESAFIERGPSIYDERGREGTIFEGFTVRGYPEVRQGMKGIIAREGFIRLTAWQIACAPGVWFGHAYGTILSMASPSAAERFAPAIITFDRVLWAALLAAFLVGSFLLFRDHAARRRFAPLFLMVVATVFLNVCKSYGRMLEPFYAVILLTVGVAVAAGLTALRRRA